METLPRVAGEERIVSRRKQFGFYKEFGDEFAATSRLAGARPITSASTRCSWGLRRLDKTELNLLRPRILLQGIEVAEQRRNYNVVKNLVVLVHGGDHFVHAFF